MCGRCCSLSPPAWQFWYFFPEFVKVIGLISGTSMDGIDAALTEIEGSPPEVSIRILCYRCYPYPPGLKDRIRAAATPEQSRVDAICHLNAYLGELFARAAGRIVNDAGIEPGEVKLIGSHGQTAYHLPEAQKETFPGGELEIRSSLQLGEAAIIAERTGITTVSNFRARDLAAGGVGAPLLPYLHFFLFGDRETHRMVINIGGIANITVIPKGRSIDTVTAFDTGPGNGIIDGLVRELSGGEKEFDRDGAMARTGRLDESLLDYLLNHPFLSRPPPKAAERDRFGDRFLSEVLDRARARHLSPADLVRTATVFVARSIAAQYRTFVSPACDVRTAIICGGGALNSFLLEALAESLPDMEVATSRDYGMDPMAVEAVGFALLAYETFHRRPGNLPRATGAGKPVVVGDISP